MDGKILEITNEMEQLYCYILLEEIREKVRRLRSYGICDEMIDTIPYAYSYERLQNCGWRRETE